jgi:hypothetical protein
MPLPADLMHLPEGSELRPIDRARRVYDREYCRRPFEDDVQLHLAHGIVHSDDRLFLLARPVQKDAPYVLVADPAIQFRDPDCWLVFLAAGDMSHILDLIPYEFPWVAWEIDNKLRYHNLKRAIQLCLRQANLLSGRHDATRTVVEPPNLQRLRSLPPQRRPLTIAP